MFMASSKADMSVVTVDMNPVTSKIARDEFGKSGVSNVEFRVDTIAHYLQNTAEKFDLFFIDGDHRGTSMRLQYDLLCTRHACDRYVMIFDDINYRRDMSLAWKEISASASGDMRINLFRWGIIIHGYELPADEICAAIRL